jgi:imidazolonepropionase-like amidohydrolase
MFPRRICLVIALSPLLLTPSAAGAESTPGQPLALDDVQLVDAAQQRVVPKRCVRIEQDRIVRITRAGDYRCSKGALRRDLEGRFLIPGLVDMHAHLTLGPLEILHQGGEMTLTALADDEIADHNARRLVAFGVTTIRNPGGDLEAAHRYKARRARDHVIGPESFDAGLVLNDQPMAGLARAVPDVETMNALVAAQVQGGADWIKLYTGLSPELLEAGIAAAHAHGRPAVAHLDHVAWTDALDMGLDGLVHLMPTSPDLLAPEARARWQSSARPGAFVFFEWWEHFDPDGPGADRLVTAFETHRPVFDATLVAFHAAFVQDQDNVYKDDTRRYAHPRLRENWKSWFTFAIGWEEDDFRRARAIWPKVQRLAYRLHATDARLTVGTDMSNPWIAPGISLHREMELLAEAGVPPARILMAATANAAEALGAGERLGRVAPGFEADLVVLDADPLADIRNTRRIHAVVLDGRYLTSERLEGLKGE